MDTTANNLDNPRFNNSNNDNYHNSKNYNYNNTENYNLVVETSTRYHNKEGHHDYTSHIYVVVDSSTTNYENDHLQTTTNNHSNHNPSGCHGSRRRLVMQLRRVLPFPWRLCSIPQMHPGRADRSQVCPGTSMESAEENLRLAE